MIYPKHDDSAETWLAWVNEHARFGGHASQELDADLRFLCGIEDRLLASLAARGAVESLRNARRVA
jgi:hypothetical protein